MPSFKKIAVCLAAVSCLVLTGCSTTMTKEESLKLINDRATYNPDVTEPMNYFRQVGIEEIYLPAVKVDDKGKVTLLDATTDAGIMALLAEAGGWSSIGHAGFLSGLFISAGSFLQDTAKEMKFKSTMRFNRIPKMFAFIPVSQAPTMEDAEEIYRKAIWDMFEKYAKKHELEIVRFNKNDPVFKGQSTVWMRVTGKDLCKIPTNSDGEPLKDEHSTNGYIGGCVLQANFSNTDSNIVKMRVPSWIDPKTPEAWFISYTPVKFIAHKDAKDGDNPWLITGLSNADWNENVALQEMATYLPKDFYLCIPALVYKGEYFPALLASNKKTVELEVGKNYTPEKKAALEKEKAEKAKK